MYAYARAALLHYAGWMLEHEVPYFDRPEKLEYPTETWAAQEFRKANVLRLAAAHADEPLRSPAAGPGRRARRPRLGRPAAVRVARRGPGRRHPPARGDASTPTSGLDPLEPAPRPDSEPDFGGPEAFVAQKDRVRAQLQDPDGIVARAAAPPGAARRRRAAAMTAVTGSRCRTTADDLPAPAQPPHGRGRGPGGAAGPPARRTRTGSSSPAWRRSGPWARNCEPRGSRSRCWAGGRGSTGAARAAWPTLLRRERVDLIHAHQYTPFFYGMLARLLHRRPPILFTEHGRPFPDYPRRKRIAANRLLLRRGDRVVAVGEAVRQALIDNEGLPGRPGRGHLQRHRPVGLLGGRPDRDAARARDWAWAPMTWSSSRSPGSTR